MPGRGGVNQIEAAGGLELLEGRQDLRHRQPAGCSREHVGHLGVRFERGDVDAPCSEQPGRLPGAGADLERGPQGPSRVLLHRVGDLIGVVEPVALVLVYDRPERQPADHVVGSVTA